MKKFCTLILSAIIICSNASLFAQNANQHFKGTQAQAFYKGADQVTINGTRNTISFIRLQSDQNISEASSKDWLAKDILKLRADDNLSQYAQENDKIGFTHNRYHQVYKGVPVEYGTYYIHCRDGRVSNANGEWYGNINISVKPKISAEQAYNNALSLVNAQVYNHEMEDKNNNELVVLPYEGNYYLAYRCDVYASQPLSRQWYFIDANSGQLIKADQRIFDDVAHGTAYTQYSGTRTIATDSTAPGSYRLRDYSRGNGVITYKGPSGTTDYTDADNIWDVDPVPVDCMFGAQATYDYYWNHFGQNGLDGNGYNLIAYAHDGLYVNAFWTGTDAHFGDGDNNTYMPLTDAMIVGHEFTHGVTQFHSALVYSCESGGLNEGFSDVFGQAIDWANNPTTASWYVSGHFGGAPFRNMADPKSLGMPDTYQGDYWNSCNEVHTGSSVLNFWYYLLVEGETGVNDVGDQYSVVGIGFDDATAIAYRTNCVYLTANSGYQDAADLGKQSAQELFGDCSEQLIQCTNAWYAVNLSELYQDAVVSNFGNDQTSFCTVPATVNFTNGSINGTSYLWDFGDGTTSTDVSPSHEYTTAGTFSVSLIVNGTALCNSADTMSKTNLIHTQNIGQPLPPSCIPIAELPGPKFGITNFTLADINNNSGNAQEGYEDFSCSAFTGLFADSTYTAQIKGSSKPNDIRMWIDYSNDGIFTNDELVYSADDITGITSAIFTTPVNPLLNVPLRVRIIEEKESYDIIDACDDSLQRGQCEDYMVYFISPVVCGVPAGLSTTNITNSSATLNWDAVSGAIKYKVRYRAVGSNAWITVTTTTNSLQLNSLTANTDYVWKVKTVCSKNPKVTSDYSDKKQFTTGSAKLGAPTQGFSFEIYPNPFESSSTISYMLKADATVSIELWNELGQKIETIKSLSTQSAGSYTYPINANGSGVYYVRITADDNISWKKVVKVK